MQQFSVKIDLLNSDGLKVAIAQLCNELATGLKLYYVITHPKVWEQYIWI